MGGGDILGPWFGLDRGPAQGATARHAIFDGERPPRQATVAPGGIASDWWEAEVGLKVRLEDIPPEGLEVEFSDQRALPRDLGEVVTEITSPPQAWLRLEKQGELVLARGEYRVGVRLQCSRCLKPGVAELAGPLELIFSPPQSPTAEEVQLGGDEMDLVFFEGDELDLAQALRDEIGLNLPMAPLCRAECAGLCPVCGRDLNQEACGCRQEKTDPRWAKLAKLEIKH